MRPSSQTGHARYDSDGLRRKLPELAGFDKAAIEGRQGRFIVGPRLAEFLETSLAKQEGIGLTLPRSKLVDSPRRFHARHGLGVSWAGVEDHVPEPPGFGVVAALLGEDGEVAHGEMAVDALVHATELVGTPQGQDSPPAGLGRLAGLAMENGLAEMDLGVVGVET